MQRHQESTGLHDLASAGEKSTLHFSQIRPYLSTYSAADVSAYILKHWFVKIAIYGSQRSNLKFDEGVLRSPLTILPLTAEWFR